MTEEKRSIAINPELFKISSNSTRKKQKSDQPNIKVRNPATAKERNNKTLKRNLIKYLRRRKEHDEPLRTSEIDTGNGKNGHVAEFESNFTNSMNYLLDLTKELESKNGQIDAKNHTLKRRASTPPIHEEVNLSLPSAFHTPGGVSSSVDAVPNYGCMKGGQLPTYRIWKNKTQRVSSGSQPPHLLTNRPMRVNEMASTLIRPTQRPYEQLKTEQMKQIKQKEPPKPKRPKQKQKTMRRTYRVGKSKVYPKISVLVSNKTIRKNVMSQTQLLKQTPIQEVKQYLIKKGFIRVGSIAPNDVLRRMYETVKTMCGEVQNHNPDNLLYNFLNSDQPN
jgi:hypothetical protein